MTPKEALKELYRQVGSIHYCDMTCGTPKETTLLLRDSEPFKIVETALKEKEQQDGVIQILKEIIEFSQVLPHIEPNKDNGFDIMSAVSINIQRDIENKERELLRKWILETCFPKELKALEIIKEKGIDIYYMKSALRNSVVFNETPSQYYNRVAHSNYTETEFNLLKEYFK